MNSIQFLAGSDTQLEPSLIQAYLETNYGVGVAGDAESHFVLNVGLRSANLIALHKRHSVDCSAYITPCNPLSNALGNSENEVRLTAMRTQLKKRSLQCLKGIGEHPGGQWPGEHSFLILGIAFESAKLLATEQEQNAFLWAAKDGIPKLVLLR